VVVVVVAVVVGAASVVGTTVVVGSDGSDGSVGVGGATGADTGGAVSDDASPPGPSITDVVQPATSSPRQTAASRAADTADALNTPSGRRGRG
jgi:hypothetical protein